MTGARRIKLIVAYDGTHYNGWQVQPDLPTIQGTLEALLEQIEGARVHVAGSGRTDAGVHALAQVAAVSICNPIPCPNLKKALNRLLPRDIRILAADEVAPGFHPRYDARSKTYEYRIWRAEVCPPFERLYVHHHPYPLSEEKLAAAARRLVGEHDFSAFAAADDRDQLGRSKVRCIHSSDVHRRGDMLAYRVRGSGFLKHMVRNIVGTLIEYAKGNLDDAGINSLLRPGASRRAGPTAPPQGLFLIGVEY
jgi:tRNA pseudouridine38-40 synthase